MVAQDGVWAGIIALGTELQQSEWLCCVSTNNLSQMSHFAKQKVIQLLKTFKGTVLEIWLPSIKPDIHLDELAARGRSTPLQTDFYFGLKVKRTGMSAVWCNVVMTH